MRTDFEEEPLEEDEEEGTLSDDVVGAGSSSSKGLPRQHSAHKRITTEEDNGFNVLARLLGNLLQATVLAVIPAALAFGFTLSVWLGSGLSALRTARIQTASAEYDYHQALTASQPILADLGSLGSPIEELETIYFAYEDASQIQQRKLADTYLGSLVAQVNLVEVKRGEVAARARKLLAPTLETRRKVSEAYLAWDAVLQTPKGKVITMLHLTPTPDPSMEVYRAPAVGKLRPPEEPNVAPQ